MSWDDFATQAKAAADWGAEYHKTIRDRPVRAQTNPGDIAALLATAILGNEFPTYRQKLEDFRQAQTEKVLGDELPPVP